MLKIKSGVYFFIFIAFSFLSCCKTKKSDKENKSKILVNNHVIKPKSIDSTKNIISKEQSQKLKNIRDSYVAINGLENLYNDKTHTNGIPYHIYISEKLEKNKAYPMVIFLHGYSDLSINTHKGFPKGVWSLPLIQKEHPHILLVPRYRTFDDMWVQNKYRKMVVEVIDFIITEHNQNLTTPNIDINRLYLTGFSQGGMGTWNYIKNYPKKFAAAAPLSGFFEGPKNIDEAKKIKHIHIWIFNGDKDKSIEGSRISYQMLVNAEARDVSYHEYKDQGHVIDDFAYFTEGFMTWFFDQNLKNNISTF